MREINSFKKKSIVSITRGYLAQASFLGLLIVAFVLLLSGCKKEEEVTTLATVTKIDAAQAKEIMDTEKDFIILDVRTQEEYDAVHIDGALLLPYDQIDQKAKDLLPDKNQKILIYCRSGNRSGIASASLLQMGYTQIYDFGGIIDWPFEVIEP